jgi:catechol 2,3-dioxygenase-like lactoylglutathione lyase family enzyme
MRTRNGRLLPASVATALVACALAANSPPAQIAEAQEDPSKRPGAATAPSSTERKDVMELGAFSVSLAVKDLAASRAFYEKLGFAQVAGEPKQKWIILRSGTTTIGLFQGMFERNMLTFNPGWSWDAKPLASFQDVREIQKTLEERGIKPTLRADPASTGVASLMVTDPDGNPILLDQHVPRSSPR